MELHLCCIFLFYVSHVAFLLYYVERMFFSLWCVKVILEEVVSTQSVLPSTVDHKENPRRDHS